MSKRLAEGKDTDRAFGAILMCCLASFQVVSSHLSPNGLVLTRHCLVKAQDKTVPSPSVADEAFKESNAACSTFFLVVAYIANSSDHHEVHELLQIDLPAAISVEEAEDVAQLIVRQPKPCRHHEPIKLRDVKFAIVVAIDCPERFREFFSGVLLDVKHTCVQQEKRINPVLDVVQHFGEATSEGDISPAYSGGESSTFVARSWRPR